VSFEGNQQLVFLLFETQTVADFGVDQFAKLTLGFIHRYQKQKRAFVLLASERIF